METAALQFRDIQSNPWSGGGVGWGGRREKSQQKVARERRGW